MGRMFNRARKEDQDSKDLVTRGSPHTSHLLSTVSFTLATSPWTE